MEKCKWNLDRLPCLTTGVARDMKTHHETWVRDQMTTEWRRLVRKCDATLNWGIESYMKHMLCTTDIYADNPARRKPKSLISHDLLELFLYGENKKKMIFFVSKRSVRNTLYLAEKRAHTSEVAFRRTGREKFLIALLVNPYTKIGYTCSLHVYTVIVKILE